MMRRICSWSKRLKRLEEVNQKQIRGNAPMAIVEAIDISCAETHLVRSSEPGAPRGLFKEMPGPGPQLADFGYFEPVLYMTPAEMQA
jgi:hypothetical protein